MSCSKIFSGNLPELTYDILKYFQKDFTTLYSCILVNRLWCRLAIPLLWENPFSISTENYNFIDIYLNNLNNEVKTKLNEYKININLLPLNTLFNYSKFIKYLNTREFISSVGKWFENVVKSSKPENNYFIQDINLPSKEFNIKRLIHMSLLKIFIENDVNLNTLCIEIYNFSDYNSYLDGILELMLQNSNFFHNIKNFKIFIRFYNYNSIVKNRILQVINSHKNLKGVILGFDNFPFYRSSLLSNCSNTLNTIVFFYVNFTYINLNNVFEQLNVLESVHIINCYINVGLIQQIINLTKPFKLKSLYMKDISNINSLKLLFQKFGDDLENFGYSFSYNYNLSLKQQLLELIIRYCKNIKFLDLYESENMINYQIFNLIENFKQNLNYLTISLLKNYHNDINEFSSIILQNLGQILPIKLKYLNLYLRIKSNDLELFLKNSQNTFIENLLIFNNKMRGEDSEDILPYLKEYIMKKKRVKYLAFMDTLDDQFHQNKDLFSMKDEVKEFEMYNIKVQNYYKSTIDIYNFIKKID
jgi:hypothetical protein